MKDTTTSIRLAQLAGLIRRVKAKTGVQLDSSCVLAVAEQEWGARPREVMQNKKLHDLEPTNQPPTLAPPDWETTCEITL